MAVFVFVSHQRTYSDGGSGLTLGLDCFVNTTAGEANPEMVQIEANVAGTDAPAALRSKISDAVVAYFTTERGLNLPPGNVTLPTFQKG